MLFQKKGKKKVTVQIRNVNGGVVFDRVWYGLMGFSFFVYRFDFVYAIYINL